MSTLTIKGHRLRHFDIQAKEKMELYLKELKVDISDYTFAANFIWLAGPSGFYTVLQDCFCLFVLSGSELSMLLPPLGKKENTYAAMEECFAIMNENNSSMNYSRIDYVYEELLEGFVEHLEEGTVIFDLLQDYLIEKKLVDYVYKTDDLVELRGNAYHTKRNEINKFRKAYPDATIEMLDSKEHGDAIVMLFNKWVSDRVKFMPKEEADQFLEGIFQERLAIKRMLKYYNDLGIVGLVLLINDELRGFTVGEQINATTSSVIIEKTDFAILGCAQFLFREFSKVLKERYGTEWINVGDDMGFENLKKVKMSYRPDKLIPKYTIYQKTS